MKEWIKLQALFINCACGWTIIRRISANEGYEELKELLEREVMEGSRANWLQSYEDISDKIQQIWLIKGGSS